MESNRKKSFWGFHPNWNGPPRKTPRKPGHPGFLFERIIRRIEESRSSLESAERAWSRKGGA